MKKVEEKFRKERSFFAEWHTDTTDVILQCLNYDFELWKIPKIVKDKADLLNLK